MFSPLLMHYLADQQLENIRRQGRPEAVLPPPSTPHSGRLLSRFRSQRRTTTASSIPLRALLEAVARGDITPDAARRLLPE